MKHNDKGITDEEFLNTFANLFDEVAENDDRDIDVQLQELGYDPTEVAKMARAAVERAFAATFLRVRFKANYEDSRPINWPVKHPYWETGFAADGSYSIVVSYADDVDYIMANWPEATDLEIERVGKYTFTERFPKPDWFNEVEA